MNSLSVFLRKSMTVILFLLVYFSSGYTAPQIRQIFPSQKFLLGQSRLWTIEIRHPIWEAYTLKINEVEGADITVVETRSRIESEEMISLYRLKIVPGSLNIQDTPSILISDGKGQNTVLNGEPLIVRSISGDSLALKEALPPVLRSSGTRSLIIYGVALVLLGLCLSGLVWRRKRASTPKQVLRRQMKRVLKEIVLTPNKYPAALEKIFRSEFFWGVRADARTASELFEVAGSDPYLKQLAETLQYLEQYRYSDPAGFTAQDRIRQSILTGLEILR
jgi:hypothetical protein